MTDTSGGFHVSGTNVNFHGPVAGRDQWNGVPERAAPPRKAAAEPAEPAGPGRSRPADVGVLTILDEEIRAVQAELQRMRDYRERRLRHGPLAREAWVPRRGGEPIRVAAVQTLAQGTESAGIAYRELVDEYNPEVVLLVGVAGGIGKKINVGDVVISDEVISYDARREGPGRTYHRGQAQEVAAPLRHRLNDFLAGTPSEQPRRDGETFRLYRGPVGSGNAVITDVKSELRRWLSEFNEKVLAVETEAAGVARSFHEMSERDTAPRGWLTIRGISDAADRRKGWAYHELAARHAAEVMAMLLPYL